MTPKRTAIVTGANSGIGLETAIGLAEQGIHVFLACRNVHKGEEAVATARQRVPDGRFSLLELDLADYASVRKCAADFAAQNDRLDILVNNAGMMTYSRRVAEDGTELQFKTNHLSHFLLTALLFPLMPDSAASRIVSLGSIAHKTGTIRFDDLTCRNALDPGAAYAQSKLACVMFAIELDRRLRRAGSKVLSVAAHPGVSQTQLFGDTPFYVKAGLMVMGPLLTHSPEQAAKPSLHAALDDGVKGGDYFGPGGLMEMSGRTGKVRPSRTAMDPNVADRLWQVSETLTGTQFTI